MQSSDHVERADAEQEGAAPGSTRGDVHDVMSQVSGGRGDRLGSGWRVRVGVVCVCVCVCVLGQVEIKRFDRDISLWGERTKRGGGFFKFKIKNTSVREKITTREKSSAPLEHF